MGDQRPPAEVFRANLHRLAGAHGLDFDTLASALTFKGEDKKWLGRLWENGLTRPDQRRTRHLNGLATFLGVEWIGDMWIPDVEANPTKLGGDNARWFRLTDTIYKCLINVKHMWNRYPKEMSEILSTNDGMQVVKDSRAATMWATHRYGYNITDDEHNVIEKLEKLSERLQTEFGDAVEYEEETWFKEQVYQRIMQHPAWPEVERRAEAANPEWRKFDSDFIWQKMDPALNDAIHQQPSVEEVYQRFAVRYMDTLLDEDESDSKPKPESTPDSLPQEIMDDLQSHPEWSRYVEAAFAGDHQEAEQSVTQKWAEAQQRHGKTVSVDTFLSFYRSRILDALKPSRITRKTKPSRFDKKPK